MKKNFFKKLSFVLALAMVLSTITPAGAFAATKLSLTAAKKYLHLDVDGLNKYNFDINGTKGKGWTYNWYTANENVATVAKNGVVTAEGVGSTKVVCEITDKSDELVKELSATVVVRDNIKSLTITNTPKDGKLNVKVENDFNRSFVTNSGSTTKTSAVTRWTVDKEGATINADNGKFVATKAGEYVVTARSFQSTEKYNTWLVSKDDTLVLATATYKVTVAATMESAKQIDKDTVQVTFTAPVTDVAANMTISSLVAATGTKIKQVIKEVKMNAENTVATVDMYIEFTADTTYVVDFTGMENVQFKAATKNDTDVTDMQIVTTQATVGTAKAIEVKLLNKDGVDITTANLLTRVTFTSSSDRAYYNPSTKELTMYTKGDTSNITAVFHTWKYDTTTGKEIGIIEKTGVITCVDVVTVTVGAVSAYTIVNDNAPDFDKVSHTLAADDQTYRLYVKAKKSDNETYANSKDDANFSFTTSDNSVLIVSPSGTLWPIKAGSAVVVVKYGDTVIDALTITINPKREASIFNLDNAVFSLSNDVTVNDSKTVKLEVLDQYQKPVVLKDVSITLNAGSVSDNLIVGSVSGSASQITFNASGADAGSYTYTVKANGQTRFININVQEPKEQPNPLSAYYKLNLSATTLDMNVKSDDKTEILTVKIYGYASNNVANDVRPVSGGSFTVEVTKPNGSVDNALLNADGTITFANAVSGSAVTKLDKGVYRLRLLEGNKVHDIATVEVKDTQATPTVTFDRTVSEKTDRDQAILDCIVVKLSGVAQDDSKITIENAGIYGSGKEVFVKYVKFTENIGGATIVHTVNVDQTIIFK
ncbi:MAG: hypothetical protein K0S47_2460 [Herbinix sp.]|jgi:hypothetical protein|nr:hypothetical protein [Herbinix sp.]